MEPPISTFDSRQKFFQKNLSRSKLTVQTEGVQRDEEYNTFEKSDQGANVGMEMELKIFLANRIFHLAQFQNPLPNHPKHLWILSRKEKVPWMDYNES